MRNQREADKEAEQEQRCVQEAYERAEQEQKRADEEQQNRQEAEFRTQIEEMYLSAVREDAGCQNNCGEQIFN
jgi:hypothetical protein